MDLLIGLCVLFFAFSNLLISKENASMRKRLDEIEAYLMSHASDEEISENLQKLIDDVSVK